MTIEQRLDALIALGEVLRTPDESMTQLIEDAHQYNAWFTPRVTRQAVSAIAAMLNAADLQTWFKKYDIPNAPAGNAFKKRTIGLVLAGNIPLVGFHDVLCVLSSGHKALIKLSSQDQKILPYILTLLVSIEPAFSSQIQLTERLENFDAVIATGSGNTSRYFEYYFGKVPNIIRKNRNSVALLTGNETEKDLEGLGHDIFDYYGLGCRNVSKIYVPEEYNFSTLFEGIEPFNFVGEHHKYHNNYDYNKSVLLLNKVKHYDNGFLLVREDEALASALAVLHYEEYSSLQAVSDKLKSQANLIQCIVSGEDLDTLNQKVGFGESQSPRLWDYADGIDTMKFLTTLQ